MPDAFTLRMFVPDGDPEGVRLLTRPPNLPAAAVERL